MYGIDIYSGDKNINLASEAYRFAIVKATEGKTFVDPSFKDFTRKLVEMGKLLGCYHYARPDNRNGAKDAAEEVDFFVKELEKEGLLGKCILAIDWEEGPIEKTDYLQAMCERTVQLSGITPFIYASLSFFKSYENMQFLQKYPHWIAYWTQIGTVNVGTKPKGFNLNYPYAIWQYTDKGKYPALISKVDLNYTNLTVKEWQFYCSTHGTTAESLSADMEWAIKNGLFIGYGDGTYRPRDKVTREQLATVLNRFYNKIFMEGK